MPDFDIDFCMEGRDRVIDYVADRYGRDRVSQIITYGTLAAKAVVRDVARVLGQNYGFADSIAKLIPFELGITLDEALRKEEELRRRYQSEDDVREVIDLARSLEGLVRNAGTHAGGVVIAPSVLTDFAPLYCEEGAAQRRHAVRQGRRRGRRSGQVRLPRPAHSHDHRLGGADDQRRARRRRRAAARSVDPARWTTRTTYALLKRCETTAVFQLESRGMRDLVRRLQPDRFEDVVALVALFRPGPLQSGMVDDFINRKHGRATGPIDYLHPELDAVLAPTYGVILYQEQVMQIAQVLAGYTLGGADLLRRAMGKKKPEEMAKQRSVFVDGAVARGVAHGDGGAHLRPDGEVRGLRLQQVALRGVRAALLPDRLAQGALPGRVHGGRAVLGHGPHRQGRHADRRVPPHGARRRGPGREQLAVHVRGLGPGVDPLRAGRDQGRRARRPSTACSRSASRAARSAICATCAAASI